MKARIQLGLLKLTDPRFVQALLIGLMLVLVVLPHAGVIYDIPACGNGGCDGG